MGVNSLPKTVTRQRRDCDLNPGPTAPESNTLTTRLRCMCDVIASVWWWSVLRVPRVRTLAHRPAVSAALRPDLLLGGVRRGAAAGVGVQRHGLGDGRRPGGARRRPSRAARGAAAGRRRRRGRRRHAELVGRWAARHRPDVARRGVVLLRRVSVRRLAGLCRQDRGGRRAAGRRRRGPRPRAGAAAV